MYAVLLLLAGLHSPVHGDVLDMYPQGDIFFTYGDSPLHFDEAGMTIIYRPEDPGPHTSTGYGSSARVAILGQYKTKAEARDSYSNYDQRYFWNMDWSSSGLYYYVDDYFVDIKSGYWISYRVEIDDYNSVIDNTYIDKSHIYHVSKNIQSCETVSCSERLDGSSSRIISAIKPEPDIGAIVAGVLVPTVLVIVILSVVNCNKNCRPQNTEESEPPVMLQETAPNAPSTSPSPSSHTYAFNLPHLQPSADEDAPPSYMAVMVNVAGGSVQPHLQPKNSEEQPPSYISVVNTGHRHQHNIHDIYNL